ncbi:hypothetical protein ACFLRY_02410 [Bacteroidota bacterium]
MKCKPNIGKFLLIVIISGLLPIGLNAQKRDTLEYRVQIGARYGQELPNNYFQNRYKIDYPVSVGRHMGWYKYTVGSFETRPPASDLRRELIRNYNVKDPFIVRFINGHRIPLDIVHYKIQIAASQGRKLSINALKRKYNIRQPVAQEYDNGYYKYVLGSYNHYGDAAREKNSLRANGVRGAFVVAYWKDKRITHRDILDYVIKNENKLNTIAGLKLTDEERKAYKRPYNRPGQSTTPIYKPTQRPAEKPQEKPAEKPVVRPEVKPQEKPVEKPVQRPVYKPEEKPTYEEPATDVIVDEDWTLAFKELQDEERYYRLASYYEESYKGKSIAKGNDLDDSDIRVRTTKWLDRNLPSPLSNWLVKIVKMSYDSILVFILLFAILFFFANLIFVIFFIFFRKTTRKRKSEKFVKQQTQYQDWLTRYIFAQDEEQNMMRRLQSIKGQKNRQILTDEILNIYVNLTGDSSIKLRDLYRQLGLDKDSIKKIDNIDWTKKIRAFREVTQMDLKEGQKKIEGYVNSHNDSVRMEAQIALVRLNEKDPFSFLDQLREYYMQWEQINIHAIIKLYGIKIPTFSRWFDSMNESVIMFAIRMATIFQQTEDYQKILKLVEHKNEKVRFYAIQAVGLLEIRDGIDELMLGFDEETYANQIAILKALQNIPDESEMEFLIYKTYEQDFDIQMEALKVLYNIGEKGQDVIKELEKERDEDFRIKVKQIFDRRV